MRVKDLANINDLIFHSFGLNDENDRSSLIENVEYLVNTQISEIVRGTHNKNKNKNTNKKKSNREKNNGDNKFPSKHCNI